MSIEESQREVGSVVYVSLHISPDVLVAFSTIPAWSSPSALCEVHQLKIREMGKLNLNSSLGVSNVMGSNYLGNQLSLNIMDHWSSHTPSVIYTIMEMKAPCKE